MIPGVYEEKIKDGKVVHNVRLVVNGKHHTQHGPTYSPTPSRQEFLVSYIFVQLWTATIIISMKNERS